MIYRISRRLIDETFDYVYYIIIIYNVGIVSRIVVFMT